MPLFTAPICRYTTPTSGSATIGGTDFMIEARSVFGGTRIEVWGAIADGVAPEPARLRILISPELS